MDDDEVQQFNLRWHNHQNSVVGALGRMYTSGALTDVTLSASGTTLKAHRLVLASCSQYFAQLFKEVEPDNTLVVVLGCSPVELRLLLSFMYTGEVTASRRALPSLLSLANTLQVAGLTDANPTFTPTEQNTKEEENTETNSPINLETKIEQPNDNSNSLDNNGNTFKFDFDYGNTDRRTSDSVDFGTERLSKLDQIVQNLYSTHRIDGPLAMVPTTPPITTSSLEEPHTRRTRGSTCSVCHKRLSNQYNLRVHMETHSGVLHACRACDHVSRSRDALRKHRAYRHPNVRHERRLE